MKGADNRPQPDWVVSHRFDFPRVKLCCGYIKA